VSEFQRRSVDRNLMEMAYAERRILLTEDKDFGWLAYVEHMDNPGVILIRFPAIARLALAGTSSFVVLRPGSVRISAIPPSE
jgi:predicted nuclease of predicted toxin-antitoxin system